MVAERPLEAGRNAGGTWDAIVVGNGLVRVVPGDGGDNNHELVTRNQERDDPNEAEKHIPHAVGCELVPLDLFLLRSDRIDGDIADGGDADQTSDPADEGNN